MRLNNGRTLSYCHIAHFPRQEYIPLLLLSCLWLFIHKLGYSNRTSNSCVCARDGWTFFCDGKWNCVSSIRKIEERKEKKNEPKKRRRTERKRTRRISIGRRQMTIQLRWDISQCASWARFVWHPMHRHQDRRERERERERTRDTGWDSTNLTFRMKMNSIHNGTQTRARSSTHWDWMNENESENDKWHLAQEWLIFYGCKLSTMSSPPPVSQTVRKSVTLLKAIEFGCRGSGCHSIVRKQSSSHSSI